MSTVQRKRREARKQRYSALLLAIRLKGGDPWCLNQYSRSRPKPSDMRWLRSILENMK